MTPIKKHLELLGMQVEDKVTGFQGVVTSIAFDLYGCVQAVVHPGTDKDGKIMDQLWFDVARLKIISDEPVMALPNFDFGLSAEGRKGPTNKPALTTLAYTSS